MSEDVIGALQGQLRVIVETCGQAVAIDGEGPKLVRKRSCLHGEIIISIFYLQRGQDIAASLIQFRSLVNKLPDYPKDEVRICRDVLTDVAQCRASHWCQILERNIVMPDTVVL
jgi:hypothetical protein